MRVSQIFLSSTATMMSLRSALSFTSSFATRAGSRRAASSFRPTATLLAAEGQAEVILVGCGAPNRGMGWYHGIQVCAACVCVVLFCFACMSITKGGGLLKSIHVYTSLRVGSSTEHLRVAACCKQTRLFLTESLLSITTDVGRKVC